MTEQVERILDAPSSLQGRRVDADPQGLGQLAPVEFLRTSGDFDGSLEQPAVHLRADEPLAEITECALGEGMFLFAETPFFVL
jgi:hypothetical protein